MLNHYPLSKYLMLIAVILIGLLYAAPNFYGEDPALQVTMIHGASVSKSTLNQIRTILEKKHISSKSIELKNRTILLRFNNPDIQLRAQDELMEELGRKFIVALYLAPATPAWLSMLGAEPMKLGLDLRGGVHFLMEVDIDGVLRKLQEQNMYTLRRALHEKGIPYEAMRKLSDSGVLVRFKEEATRNKAISYINQQSRNMILSSHQNNIIKANLSDAFIKEVREYVLQQNLAILRKRVNQIGISEPIVQRQGTNYIVVELPGIQNTAHAKEILGATATIEFRLVNTTVTESNRIPADSEVKNTRDGSKIVLYKREILTGDHITYATSSKDEYNKPQVNISLDAAGGTSISTFTKDNIGKPMATLFVEYKDSGKKDAHGHSLSLKKEEVINVANIQSRLGNRFCITGIRSASEARQLALLLRAGTLISPIQIIEERAIGPSLGHKNILQGLQACFFGLITSIIFMLACYRKFGLIDIAALLANLVLIIGSMSLLPGATLTMPGIAGIVLTMAVAIDAHVLINESIKEELKLGHSVQKSIHKGYKNAFSTIIDANITTLITVVILYILGTGSIKGFAVTTGIGVLTSMFTSIIGTRAIVNFIYGGKRVNKLSI